MKHTKKSLWLATPQERKKPVNSSPNQFSFVGTLERKTRVNVDLRENHQLTIDTAAGKRLER